MRMTTFRRDELTVSACDNGMDLEMVQMLKERIRHVADFPKPGILFYDVTTLLKDREGFQLAVAAMAEPHRQSNVDVVVGIESRGFIFGSAIADRLKVGFAPVRKLGKLPSRTRRASYALEYGMDSLEIHEDAAASGQRVLVVDDLLATGGTAAATVGLVRGLGAHVVGVQFLIELLALKGREKLAGENVGAVLAY
jgi:adenine phosphoribosyltransferase